LKQGDEPQCCNIVLLVSHATASAESFGPGARGIVQRVVTSKCSVTAVVATDYASGTGVRSQIEITPKHLMFIPWCSRTHRANSYATAL
ncbi:hypothetical protein CSUI_009029, partial [Cystoisospora suis]